MFSRHFYHLRCYVLRYIPQPRLRLLRPATMPALGHTNTIMLRRALSTPSAHATSHAFVATSIQEPPPSCSPPPSVRSGGLKIQPPEFPRSTPLPLFTSHIWSAPLTPWRVRSSEGSGCYYPFSLSLSNFSLFIFTFIFHCRRPSSFAAPPVNIRFRAHLLFAVPCLYLQPHCLVFVFYSYSYYSRRTHQGLHTMHLPIFLTNNDTHHAMHSSTHIHTYFIGLYH